MEWIHIDDDKPPSMQWVPVLHEFDSTPVMARRVWSHWEVQPLSRWKYFRVRKKVGRIVKWYPLPGTSIERR